MVFFGFFSKFYYVRCYLTYVKCNLNREGFEASFESFKDACSKGTNEFPPERRLECCQTSAGGFKAYNPNSMCCSDGRVLSLGLC